MDSIATNALKRFYCCIALLLMLSVAAVAVLLACGLACPQRAYAQETYSEDTLYYIVDGGSVTVTGYFGRDAEVEVPSMIAGYPVNAIAAGAFAGTAARVVRLPDCVTDAADGAFGEGVQVIWAEDSSDGGSSGVAVGAAAGGGSAGDAVGGSGGSAGAVSSAGGAGESEASVDFDEVNGSMEGIAKVAGKENAGLFSGSSNSGFTDGSDVVLAGAAIVIAILAAGVVLVVRRIRKKV